MLGQVQENYRKSKDRTLEERYKKNTENLGEIRVQAKYRKSQGNFSRLKIDSRLPE
jgi:hypothetical protein